MAVDSRTTSSTTASSGTSTTVNKSADLGLIRNAVSDVLNAKAKAVDYTASASAEREKAAGFDAAGAGYQNAANVADLYAVYTRATGEISALQQQRQAQKTIGTQQAQLAGGGFGADTGSAVDQVKSSLQESYLATQLVRTQSRMEEGGYLEQAAASRAQLNASNEAKSQALTTAGVYDDAAAQSKQQAANETIGLSGYLSAVHRNGGGPMVDANSLISGQDIGTSLALAPQIVQQTSVGGSVTNSTTSTHHSDD